MWKTAGGAKPDAVIEAKTSYDPTKGLKALLGEAGDKTESSSGTNTPHGQRKRGGRFGSRGSSSDSGAVRQTNGKVTQMSHAWIERRLPRALSNRPTDLQVFRRLKGAAYSRHVQLFSIPQAAAHAEALLLHASGRAVEHDVHAAHELTGSGATTRSNRS